MKKIAVLMLCAMTAMPALAWREVCDSQKTIKSSSGIPPLTLRFCTVYPETAAERKAMREAAEAPASTYKNREDDRPRALDLRVIQDNGQIKTVVDDKTGKFYLCSKNLGCI